jgi:hypothetical protein
MDPFCLFTIGATALAALLFGAIPALHASAGQLASTLREGNRGSRTRPGSSRARGALVVAEMTLALMLLAGAGLLLKSFARLRDVDPGFAPARVSTFTVTLSPVKYATPDQQRAFATTLLDKVRAIPGVDSAGLTFGLPLSGAGFVLSFEVAGRPAPAPSDEPAAQVRMASAGYFGAMGIPLKRGRAFGPSDRSGAPRVFVISEETARRYFPGEDPIGRKHPVRLVARRATASPARSSVSWATCGRMRLSGDLTPHAYVPFDQWPVDELTVVMRTRADPVGDASCSPRRRSSRSTATCPCTTRSLWIRW